MNIDISEEEVVFLKKLLIKIDEAKNIKNQQTLVTLSKKQLRFQNIESHLNKISRKK